MDSWPPPKPRVRRAVAVPSSTFSQLREPARTLHAAFLSRALAIFRVENAFVYEESATPCTWLLKVLRAFETPQYLRRRLIPHDEDLKYIGIAPPLATPSHQLRSDNLPFREGVVLRRLRDGVLVEAGLREPIAAKGFAQPGARVTLVRKGDEWVVADSDSLAIYWGFRVRCFNSLKELLEASANDHLIVFTSRYGVPFHVQAEKIREEAVRMGRLLLVFGSWDKGLHEIAEKEGFSLQSFSRFVVNIAPFQGVRTIRTEEAVMIALSLVNSLVE